MVDRDRPHILVRRRPVSVGYTERRGGGGGDARSVFSTAIERRRHAETLEQQFKAVADTDQLGHRIEFRSYPGLTLALEQMESRRRGKQPRLDSVRFEETGVVETAVVFVPRGKTSHFLRYLDRYADSVESDPPKGHQLVESIHEIRQATVHSLWTDPVDAFPTGAGRHWWEIWLYDRNGEGLSRLVEEAKQGKIQLSTQYLGFGRGAVTLINATVDELGQVLSAVDSISEIRRPHDSVNTILDLQPYEQQDWVNDLRGRVAFSEHARETSVCVLDERVDVGHALLSEALRDSDVHVARPGLIDRDNGAHATKMAGIALFGDLALAVSSGLKVHVNHVLESVQVLWVPNETEGDKVLFASLMVDAASRVEIQEPTRKRVFLSAVTTDPDWPAARGEQPTSWSTALDALAFGHSIEVLDHGLSLLTGDDPLHQRLFVQAVGNIDSWRFKGQTRTQDLNDLEAILDPSQAWNALSVGAFTEMDQIELDALGGEEVHPLVGRGSLSPSSRTSVNVDRKWPRKPEVVAEGGNFVGGVDLREVYDHESVSVLTTGLSREGQAPFSFANGTSPASARVAQIAAEVWAAYPELWPETIRGLVVHSAEWTKQMRDEIDRAGGTRGAYVQATRRFGMGVPDLNRAMRSAADALTLVSESELQPFDFPSGGARSNSGRTNEMTLHELPWPAEELLALGETPVSMRVTLSYFIEPNPMRRGWSGRYQYPSHMLRFHVRNQNETIAEFQRRLNTRGDDGDYQGGVSDAEGWLVGSNGQRAAGAIVSDIWRGTAVELARRGVLAVVPVKGWWAENLINVGLKKVRYSLIVSIEAPDVEVDLWTAVSNKIETPIEVAY